MQLIKFIQLAALLATAATGAPAPGPSTDISALQSRQSGVTPGKSTKKEKEPYPNKMQYSCGYCGKKYWNMPDLTAHINFRHPGKPVKTGPFKRDILGDEIPEVAVVQPRQSGVTPGKSTKKEKEPYPNKREYSCGYCGKKYWNMPDLTAHINFRHPGKPVKTGPFKRDISEDEIPEVAVVQPRQSGVTPGKSTKKEKEPYPNKREYSCGYCGKKYWNMPDLTAHINFRHPGKPIKTGPFKRDLKVEGAPAVSANGDVDNVADIVADMTGP